MQQTTDVSALREPTELTFPGSDGKTTIYATLWTPDTPPRCILQICHGMGEHIARYDWLAREFVKQGFAVCGDDHLGHGRTALTREDLGYFGPKNGYLHLMEDEHLLHQEMLKRYPGVPYFLLGHSMGSFITRLYVSHHAEGLNGYICCGTSGANPMTNIAIFLSNVMILLQGGKARGNVINKMTFQDYNKRFDNVVTGHEWLSRDTRIYTRYADDEKCGFVFTNAGFRDLFHLVKSVSGRQWSDRIPKDLPMILCSGEMDPVGNYGEGVKQVYGWLKDSGMRDVTLKLYPEARHELHNELNRDEFVADLVTWVEQHMNHD